MYTTHQVAQRANIADNTVRHYVRDFPDLVSPAARGENGARLFSEEDLQTICSLAALKRSGMPLSEAAERIRNQEVPPVVDVNVRDTLQPPANALQVAEDNATSLQLAFNALQAYREADKAQIAALQRQVRDQLWTHGVAFYFGMVTMGVIFWLVWLLNQWWYGP